MQIKAAIATILLAGIVAVVILFVGDRTLKPVELENVKAVCEECHGEVPAYEFALKVHKKHAAFECGFCHREIGPLKTAESIHKTFKWLGIGILSLSLMGIALNFIVSHKKSWPN